MCCSDIDVKLLLRSLAPKVAGLQERLTSQELGNALYGLQRMTSSSDDVRLIIRALIPKIESCVVPIEAATLSRGLYGLQSMSSDCDDVRALIRALVPKVESCDMSLSGHDISHVLYGLQGMSSDSADAILLLDALQPIIDRSESSLSIQEVANALYGLQGMTGTASGQSIISYLLSQSCLNDDMTKRELITLGQSVYLMLPILSGTRGYEGWEKVKNSISMKLSLKRAEVHHATSGQSAAELRIQDIASSTFDGSNVLFTSNEYLCDVFECDLVLQLVNTCMSGNEGDSSILKINIEVDGVFHELERKKRFCRLRDAYLRSKHVSVMRISVAHLETLDDAAVKKWLLDGLPSRD